MTPDASDIHHPLIKAMTPPALALLGDSNPAPAFMFFGHPAGEWASLLAGICSVLFIDPMAIFVTTLGLITSSSFGTTNSLAASSEFRTAK